jgi:hypothetical protein
MQDTQDSDGLIRQYVVDQYVVAVGHQFSCPGRTPWPTHLMSTGVEKRCFLGVKARFESFGVSGIFIKWPLPGRRRPPPVMHVFMHNPL